MNKKRVLLVVGVLLLAAVVTVIIFGRHNPILVSRKDPPHIKVDKSLFDMGTVAEGVEVPHVIPVRNIGGEPLKIINVHTSCGCTMVNMKENVIEPGKTATLEVVMDTSMKQGVVRKAIEISSNDPKTPKITVYLSANVLPKAGVALVKSSGATNMGMSSLMTGEDPALANDPHAGLTEAGQRAKIFTGNCATCHVQQGKGKLGDELFKADCAMCHGMNGEGGVGPRLISGMWDNPAYYQAMRQVVRNGSKTHVSMPGFSQAAGGPLTDVEIESILQALKKRSLSMNSTGISTTQTADSSH